MSSCISHINKSWNIRSGRTLRTAKSTKETGMATSKPMDGGSYRETGKHDSVGEISEKNITSTKQVIDDAAARFWAKRGLQDPSKSRISYGRKLK